MILRRQYAIFLVWLVSCVSSAFVPLSYKRRPSFVSSRGGVDDAVRSAAGSTELQCRDMDETIHPVGDWNALPCSSLASSYVIRIDSSGNHAREETWSLFPIADIPGMTGDMAEGAQAMLALEKCAEGMTAIHTNWDSAMAVLKGSFLQKNNHLIVTCQGTVELDARLMATISRIMIQRIVSRQEPTEISASATWRISLPGEDTMIVSNLLSEGGILTLFSPLLDTLSTKLELVEMVNQKGQPLGIVPRPLVHSFNLLHRGIGMVVTKDKPILSSGQSTMGLLPDLYVHRRTDTKRIFPSLYDMFVGGVSSAGEDPRMTAAREVAEELGLSRALHELETTNDSTALSHALLDCTVCTSYNRCVVTVFCYTFDSTTFKDVISWQEEEVAWGDFVPYAVIEAAAKHSIERLVSSGTWPGSSSDLHALSLPHSAKRDDYCHDGNDTISEWDQWDFVPDGLLVWEAWQKWQQQPTLS